MVLGLLVKQELEQEKEQGCQDDIDVYFSTFKSIASIGAFLAADKDIDYLNIIYVHKCLQRLCL
jgi:glycine C-acetyltransferase